MHVPPAYLPASRVCVLPESCLPYSSACWVLRQRQQASGRHWTRHSSGTAISWQSESADLQGAPVQGCCCWLQNWAESCLPCKALDAKFSVVSGLL